MMRSPASLTRRSFLPAGILLLALVLFGTPRSSGQDFRRIVEIVGDMEDSLNIRIRNETELRRHETEQLRSDIVQLRSALEEARRSAAAHDSLLQKALVKPAAAPASAYPTAKVGVLSQFQISGLQEKTTAAQDANPNYHPHWSRQMTLRRMRILVGANLSASTSLFFESDTPLLGQVAASGAKDVKLAMNIQDAYVQQTIVPEFSILAGLQLVGITRNSLQSAATLMPVNYGAYAFATASALDTYTGRDLGIAVRGFLFDE